MEGSFEEQLQRAAVLRDPLRRQLYRYVCAQGREVGRDEAAEAIGAGRARVASQLDKLAEAGLLEVSFRRLNERRGPGAGRPAKLYRPSAREVELSLPPRRYSLAADVLAGAIERAGAGQEAVDDSARELGRKLGEARKLGDGTCKAVGAPPSRRRLAAAVEAIADEYGFEPARSDLRVILTNCPFRALVERRGELVCKMNLALFEGVLTGLGGDRGCATRRAPARGCCVTVDLRTRAV